MMHRSFKLRAAELSVLLLILVGTISHGQNVDPCIEAGVLVSTNLPDADKAHWFKVIESCTPTTGAQVLAGVTRAIRERGRLETILAAEAGSVGDLKTQISHLELAVSLDPNSQQLAVELKAARNALSKRISMQIDSLLAVGKTDDAIKLLNDPDIRGAANPGIVQALTTLRHQPENRMIAEANVGHYDAALNDLGMVLESNPSRPVLELTQGNTLLEWAALRAFVAANAEVIIETIIVVGVFIWLIVRLLRRYSERHVLVLRDFVNNELAPGIEQAIQAMLMNLSRGSSTSTSGGLRVTRPVEGITLPVDISKVLPASASWMQIIPGLVSRIFPRRALPITGVLHKDSSNGAGLTVHIVTDDGSHWSETFWEAQFGNSKTKESGEAGHYELAEYVAIWLLYRYSKPGFSMLGVREWRSYALFRAGVNAKGETSKALYLQALRADGNLQAARLNLALMAGTDERPMMMDLLRCAADHADVSDATRYQARYSLASLRYDVAGVAPAFEEMQKLFKAVFEACHIYRLSPELISQSRTYFTESGGDPKLLIVPPLPAVNMSLRELIAMVRSGFKAPEHVELEKYIKYLIPIARAMSLGLKLSMNPRDTNAWAELEGIAAADQSPRVRYNLACTSALIAQGLPKVGNAADTALLHKHLRQGLQSFELALWLDPSIGGKARDDKSLTGLRDCQELLDGEAVSVKFERIAATYLDPPKTASSLQLSEFSFIEPEFVQLLASLNIKSADDLVNGCTTDDARKKLATTLRVGNIQVKEWATSTELTKIDGLSPRYVNLLFSSRVLTIAQLAAATSASIYAAMIDWAKSGQTIVPPETDIEKWIKAAAQIRSSVV